MNKEEIYQSIEHIAKCEMYDVIEVKYLKSKFEELQQQNKKYKEVIDKLKRYIEKCLKITPTDDRTESDDVLDNEYEYLLNILKEVK